MPRTITKLLNIKQAAEVLGCSVSTLYDWRTDRKGPKGARIGGRVMYRESDLEAWIEAQFEAAS
jgi:excisionase family DNA binding protein